MEQNWKRWWAASGAGGKRTWWVGRYIEAPNCGCEPYENSRGTLVRFASFEAAQRTADKLNNPTAEPTP